MRRRITFVQRPETPFDHDQAVLTSDALSITNLDGAREERATFSFDELPSEVSRLSLAMSDSKVSSELD
jgi:hypothetical protein